ncbi:MAG: hypothetical protein DRQ01_04420, partial [Ignavibacteriae bacterium]
FYDTGAAFGVAVSGSYAYVADWYAGLRIIDVSRPTSPQEVGFYNTSGNALGVAVSGSYAYVANWADGLRIIDVSTPSSPVEVGFFDTGDFALGVAANGDLVYVANGGNGLRIIDVSTPSNPIEVGFYDTGVGAWGVAVIGSYSYVADDGDGIYIIQNDLLVGINEETSFSPGSFLLAQNYPNPFNPTTTIKFQIPELSFVTLKVYDVLGSEITTLVSEEKTMGRYEVEFNAITLPSGIYFYRLQAGDFVETKKMMLLK